VADLGTRKLLGHIPTGWFPTQVRMHGETVFVANAKGHGTGPNSDPEVVKRGSFQGHLRRGTMGRFKLPATGELDG
jgi:hypothetical protein